MIDAEKVQRALAQLTEALARSDLTKEDLAMLHEIHVAVTVSRRRFQKLMRAYYHDLDRADRTPREVIYLHLGLLDGMLG